MIRAREWPVGSFMHRKREIRTMLATQSRTKSRRLHLWFAVAPLVVALAVAGLTLGVAPLECPRR